MAKLFGHIGKEEYLRFAMFSPPKAASRLASFGCWYQPLRGPDYLATSGLAGQSLLGYPRWVDTEQSDVGCQPSQYRLAP